MIEIELHSSFFENFIYLFIFWDEFERLMREQSETSLLLFESHIIK